MLRSCRGLVPLVHASARRCPVALQPQQRWSPAWASALAPRSCRRRPHLRAGSAGSRWREQGFARPGRRGSRRRRAVGAARPHRPRSRAYEVPVFGRKPLAAERQNRTHAVAIEVARAVDRGHAHSADGSGRDRPLGGPRVWRGVGVASAPAWRGRPTRSRRAEAPPPGVVRRADVEAAGWCTLARFAAPGEPAERHLARRGDATRPM